MRYAVLAIGLSLFLLWDAVGNDSHYRLAALKIVNSLLRSLGLA